MNKKLFYTFAGVVAVGVAAGLVFNFASLNNSESNPKTNPGTGSLTADLPPCGGTTFFTVAPLENSAYSSIAPLGNINPPEHVTPTDHLYFVLKRDSSKFGAGSGSGANSTLTANVKAPGDITILQIMESKRMNADGSIFNTDYSIDFSPCSGVYGRFGHLSSLSPEMQAAVGSFKRCQEMQVKNSNVAAKASNCISGRIMKKVKAGTVIGVAGGKQSAALDLGLYDSSKSGLLFANQSRYGKQTFQTVCPLDYFTADLQKELKSHLGDGAEPRTVAPVCGEIMQDKPGTLQGNWFIGETKDGFDGQKIISFIHDNRNPKLGVISVGGTLSLPAVWAFLPKHEGNINREFAEIKAGEAFYCYEIDGQGPYQQYRDKNSGRLILQLVDGQTLKIERQEGKCGGVYAFSAPTIYAR